jgi:CpeT protein
MKRILPSIVLLHALAGCGGEISKAPELGLDTAGLSQGVDHAEIVYIWLEGDFDSSAQARQDSAYAPVSLRMCEANVPELGSRVLYVEQAMMGRADKPYRQRIYSIEPDGDNVASYIYGMTEEVNAAMVGACDSEEPETIAFEDIRPLEGCTVRLKPEGEDRYVGGTSGQGCESRLGGASYATSEITLGPLSIESWDRGWTADGEQAWGATEGPYLFMRGKE